MLGQLKFNRQNLRCIFSKPPQNNIILGNKLNRIFFPLEFKLPCCFQKRQQPLILKDLKTLGVPLDHFFCKDSSYRVDQLGCFSIGHQSVKRTFYIIYAKSFQFGKDLQTVKFLLKLVLIGGLL